MSTQYNFIKSLLVIFAVVTLAGCYSGRIMQNHERAMESKIPQSDRELTWYLSTALQRNDVVYAAKLILAGANPYAEDMEGWHLEYPPGHRCFPIDSAAKNWAMWKKNGLLVRHALDIGSLKLLKFAVEGGHEFVSLKRWPLIATMKNCLRYKLDYRSNKHNRSAIYYLLDKVPYALNTNDMLKYLLSKNKIDLTEWIRTPHDVLYSGTSEVVLSRVLQKGRNSEEDFAVFNTMMQQRTVTNYRDSFNTTSLMHAAETGLPYVKVLLRDKNQPRTVSDINGNTAIDYARRAGLNDVVEHLKPIFAKIYKTGSEDALRENHQLRVQKIIAKLKNNRETRRVAAIRKAKRNQEYEREKLRRSERNCKEEMHDHHWTGTSCKPNPTESFDYGSAILGAFDQVNRETTETYNNLNRKSDVLAESVRLQREEELAALKVERINRKQDAITYNQSQPTPRVRNDWKPVYIGAERKALTEYKQSVYSYGPQDIGMKERGVTIACAAQGKERKDSLYNIQALTSNAKIACWKACTDDKNACLMSCSVSMTDPEQVVALERLEKAENALRECTAQN